MFDRDKGKISGVCFCKIWFCFFRTSLTNSALILEAFWLHFEAWRPLGRPNWHHFEPWKTPRATIVASWSDLGDSLGDFGDIFVSLVTPGARFGVILEPCWLQKGIPGAPRVPKWLPNMILFRLKTWDEIRSLSRGTFSHKK